LINPTLRDFEVVHSLAFKILIKKKEIRKKKILKNFDKKNLM